MSEEKPVENLETPESVTPDDDVTAPVEESTPPAEEAAAPVEKAEAAPAEAAPAEEAPAPVAVAGDEAGASAKRGLRKTRVGVVISDKMANTIIVESTRRVPHPQFRKIVKRTSKYYVHDEKDEAKEGDKVLIQETRPLSKLKRWRLVEVLQH